MKNKKRFVLNIAFILVLILTIIFWLGQYFHYKNELKTARNMYGEGYYIYELFMVFAPIILLIDILAETSIYFNMRYFLFAENKTTIKTVFNIILLIVAIGLVIISFL